MSKILVAVCILVGCGPVPVAMNDTSLPTTVAQPPPLPLVPHKNPDLEVEVEYIELVELNIVRDTRPPAVGDSTDSDDECGCPKKDKKEKKEKKNDCEGN
jgi:hypothetical protein